MNYKLFSPSVSARKRSKHSTEQNIKSGNNNKDPLQFFQIHTYSSGSKQLLKTVQLLKIDIQKHFKLRKLELGRIVNFKNSGHEKIRRLKVKLGKKMKFRYQETLKFGKIENISIGTIELRKVKKLLARKNEFK